MHIRQFFNNSTTHASFCFGRCNPPHAGHGKLFEAVKNTANGGDWYVFISKTTDNKNNPLIYEQKISWIKTMFPEISGHLVEDISIRDYLKAASYLYEQGYRSVTFVAGKNDLDRMSQPLLNYNGAKNKHGFYKFESINFINAVGPDKHARYARIAAKNNDLDTFQNITEIADTRLAKKLMTEVRMGLLEAEEKHNDLVIDAETEEVIRHAVSHYPKAKTPLQAFIVWAIHALKHSEADDKTLKSAMKKLEKKISDLSKKIDSSSNEPETPPLPSIKPPPTKPELGFKV